MNTKVRLLKAQADLIDAIDERYDVSLMNTETLKVSLPLQPSTYKQLSIDGAEMLLASGRLSEFLVDLEERQIRLALEMLGFAYGQALGTGMMATPIKGYSRAGSDVRVRLITEKSKLKNSTDRVFSYAVITKPGTEFRETAKTAEELLDSLGRT